MAKKFYRTVYAFEVLSDQPVGSVSLIDLNYLTTEGHCSGAFLDTKMEEVPREKMAELLTAQGTVPGFLLDEEDE